MLPLEQAREQILSYVPLSASESVPLSDAHARVLAASVFAPCDLPAFDNSAMDGYAVLAEDLVSASPSNPVRLDLVGTAAAGEVFPGLLSRGQCLRVFTGSPLPQGADAVIMQEDTRLDPSHPAQPLMLDRVKPWENVRFRGEDVKRGAPVLEEGTRLTIGQAGLLAALGYTDVMVRRRPIIGLMATGSELQDPGRALAPGQIYESNRLTLAMLASQAGAQILIFPIIADDLASTEAALRSALACCDAVVTSGGVSVGDKDLVKAAFEGIGGKLSFWKVAVKPGKPFVLGQYDTKLLFGLPGNPVSAFVTFLLLVRPALLRFQGASNLGLPVWPGVLQEPLVNHGERRHFMRVILDARGQVRSAGGQASHLLNSMARANGLVDVPGQTTLPAGTGVHVLTWDA